MAILYIIIVIRYCGRCFCGWMRLLMCGVVRRAVHARRMAGATYIDGAELTPLSYDIHAN